MASRGKRCNITTCQILIRVRYNEVDRQNAVHHSRYAIYFEMGRTELLRINGYDYKTMEDKDLHLVVARLEVRFKAPAGYDDELELTTTMTKADRVRLEHSYELLRPSDDQMIAVGKTVLVHIDDQGKLQPIPDFLFPENYQQNKTRK